MKKSVRVSLLASALSAVLVSPVMAYESLPAAPEGKGFIGLGVLSKPDYEGSDTNKTTAAPFGKYVYGSGRYIKLGGTGGSETAGRLSLNLVSTGSGDAWTAGPIVQYRLKRDDDVDNRQVKRMKEVDAATELGAFVGFKAGSLSGEMNVAVDASGKHDGYLVYLGGSYELMRTGSLLMSLGASTTWADGDYMDTYFGVNGGNNGASTLPFYKADGGFKDVSVNLTSVYYLNKTWAVAGVLSYTQMLNDAEDSPLVDGNQSAGDKAQTTGILAVMYNF